MITSADFHLSGGMFFMLLTDFKRNNEDKNAYTMTNPEAFARLIQCIRPQYKPGIGRSVNSEVSKYRNCQRNSGSIFPFNDPTFHLEAEKAQKEKHGEALGRMSHFLKEYLDFTSETKYTLLVAALLDLIAVDENIPDDAVFYTNVRNEPITKAELISSTNFNLVSFLLGVWLYTILNVKRNDIAEETFKACTTKVYSNYIRFNGRLGGPFIDRIYVEPPSGINHTDSNQTEDEQIPESSRYILKLQEKYSPVGTQDFDDIYVQRSVAEGNLLSRLYSGFIPEHTLLPEGTRVIVNAGSDTFPVRGGHVLLCAPYGAGKTTFLRHLLLDAAKLSLEAGVIPFLTDLSTFGRNCINLESYIMKRIEPLCGQEYGTEFEEILENGKALIMLDGLEEISDGDVKTFHRLLNDFIDKYPGNRIIITTDLSAENKVPERFSVYTLLPFEEEQSLNYAKKLAADEESGSSFEKQLLNLANSSYRSLTAMPLYISALYEVYRRSGTLNPETPEFYLSIIRSFSAGKEFVSGLEDETFFRFLAEFSFKNLAEGYTSFTEDRFKKSIAAMKTLKNTESCSSHALVADLCGTTAVMLSDGMEYRFVHHGFQEYFSAQYISAMDDGLLWKAVDALENIHVRNKDLGAECLSILYNSDSGRICRRVFEPFLRPFCNEFTEENFARYIEKVHPALEKCRGLSSPASMIMSVIMQKTPSLQMHAQGYTCHYAEWDEDCVYYQEYKDVCGYYSALKDFLAKNPEINLSDF